MEKCHCATNHAPAFASYDWNSDLPSTRCFESAKRTGMIRYSCSEDRELYFPGDLYDTRGVAPAVIVVPPRREKVRIAEGKDERQRRWIARDVKHWASPTSKPPRIAPKPMEDEDLYKIPVELLYAAKPRKKRGLRFLLSCLVSSCIA